MRAISRAIRDEFAFVVRLAFMEAVEAELSKTEGYSRSLPRLALPCRAKMRACLLDSLLQLAACTSTRQRTSA